MTFCSSSKVAVFSLFTIDVDLCLNMSEDLNQIYCRRSLDMNLKISNVILIGDWILLENSYFQSRNAKITRFWNRVVLRKQQLEKEDFELQEGVIETSCASTR